MGTPLLKTQSLSISFGGVHAVDKVDMEVEKGQVFAIIGPNGAGKTTFFNLVSGYYFPTGGTVTFKGEDITRLKAYERTRRGIGRTFQNIMLFRELSVLDNAMVGLHSRLKSNLIGAFLRTRATREEEERGREEVRELLHFVGLDGHEDNLAKNLPYGMQKRLEIARALATRPELLLLDEPAAGLPTQELSSLVEIIQKIRDRGITVILIEHKMDVVMSISDRIMVLNFGEKIAEGTPEEVRHNQAVIEAYLGKEE
ncbi:MAG TPA: ABC transporter ATP-binding protein [Firmicutes bacterium]|nr:ABC transporter ATP-binding protein [Bacillota bacterium]